MMGAVSLGWVHVATPKPAEAVLGILLPGAGQLVVEGFLSASMGVSLMIWGHKPDSWYGGPAMILAGIIMLDSSQRAGFQWGVMDESQARQLAVSDEDRKSYNSELPTLRAVSEEAAESANAEESTAVWKEYLPGFAPGTQRVLRAVGRFETGRLKALPVHSQ
jgi:hypothetical protein